MSFDEQLQQAFETLTDRLRDGIAREVRSLVDELTATARTDRERAAQDAARTAADAARTATDEAVRTATDEAARAASESARAAADRASEAARDEARQANRSARERLVASIRTIDRARSLTEIFDALADAGAREAPRAAVVLVRDGKLR